MPDQRVRRHCSRIFRLSEAPRELRDELGVELSAPFRLTLRALRSGLSVIQALGFGTLEHALLRQQVLALVALARATPLQHHRRHILRL